MTLPNLTLIKTTDDLAGDIADELQLNQELGIAPRLVDPFTPTRGQPAPELRPRGVYVADWFYRGQPFLFSINSHHEWEHFEIWRADETREAVEARLWDQLNAADPIR